MKLKEFYDKIKNLNLPGDVIVPFRKLQTQIKSIGQFGFVADVTISFIEDHTPMSVKDFIKIMGDAMTYAGRTSKYVDIELYYGDDETIYNLVDIYFDDKNLYLIIGDEK